MIGLVIVIGGGVIGLTIGLAAVEFQLKRIANALEVLAEGDK